MQNPVDALTAAREHLASAARGVLESGAVHTASDDELVEVLAVAGDLLRLVEGVVLEGVAEIAERSRMRATDERLTTRRGCHNVSELVQRLTRCSSQTAAKWERAQRAVAATWDPLTGEERPARLPSMRTAVLEGHAGADGVLAVAGPLLEMRDRVARDRVMLADEVLAAHARGEGPDGEPPAGADVLRTHAQVWAAVLDEDGAEPTERDAALRRGLTLGRTRNGIVPIRGGVLPDVAAQLERIVDATSPVGASVRFDGPDDGDEFWNGLDDRTRAHRLHDALALALDVAARSEELPTIGGAAPTLVVAVREEDLLSDTGWAYAEGVDAPVTLNAARHAGCAGVVQRIALDRNGRITRLGTEERLFNRRQRRAIALRDGGCVIPGCGVPAAWCQIHHVLDHAKGGPTHPDNGVLLCWWHHRFIDSGFWRIRMNAGVPEVQAPRWYDHTQRWRPVTKSRVRMLDLVGRRT